MTNEEKELLLKDLCARLPYGVKFPDHIEGDCNHRECDCIGTIDTISEDEVEFTYEDNGRLRDWSCPISYVKPYLRPMSSMTEEEDKELEKTLQYTQFTLESYDWLNAHHFDYRGLIKNNLALEAPKGMYEKI